jgi:hypothetical protein
MALNIMEKVAPNPSKPGQPDGQRKRKRSESESVAGSGSASGSGNRGGGQQGHQSGPRGRGGRGGRGGSARGGRVQGAYSTQVRTHFLDNYSDAAVDPIWALPQEAARPEATGEEATRITSGARLEADAGLASEDFTSMVKLAPSR